MKRKACYILSILILVFLAWALAGYSFNRNAGGSEGWLRSHVGDDLLITLQVSFFDEIGKVLIGKLIEVEEGGIVVTLIGDITSERDGRADHGDRITLWTDKKLPVFLTYSGMVSIQPFEQAKETVWKYVRQRQKLEKLK
jgi:hypothetical protein